MEKLKISFIGFVACEWNMFVCLFFVWYFRAAVARFTRRMFFILIQIILNEDENC